MITDSRPMTRFLRRLRRQTGADAGREHGQYVCNRHGRQTNLRCLDCRQPICIRCATYIQGVGYACKGCQRARLKRYYRVS